MRHLFGELKRRSTAFTMVSYGVIGLAFMVATTCHALTNSTRKYLWPFAGNIHWNGIETVDQVGGCCQPDKMEALVSLFMGRAKKGEANMYLGVFKYYQDVTLGIDFYDGVMKVNGRPLHVNSWYDFKKKIQYTIFKGGKTEHCTKQNMKSEPWGLKCIPAGTKKLGKAYFGNQKAPNKLDVTWYEFDGSDYHAYSSFADTPRADVCIPVTYSQYGTSEGVPYTMTIEFMDIVMGVKNSDVFKIPSICLKDNDFDIPTGYDSLASALLR